MLSCVHDVSLSSVELLESSKFKICTTLQYVNLVDPSSLTALESNMGREDIVKQYGNGNFHNTYATGNVA